MLSFVLVAICLVLGGGGGAPEADRCLWGGGTIG